MSENLEAQLRQQLTTAMRAKDQRTANLVRMINTKIMERRTAKGFSGEVDDALILDVIKSYKKNMEKARAEFVAVGERGKAEVEQLDFELAWCSKMLPAQVTGVLPWGKTIADQVLPSSVERNNLACAVPSGCQAAYRAAG